MFVFIWISGIPIYYHYFNSSTSFVVRLHIRHPKWKFLSLKKSIFREISLSVCVCICENVCGCIHVCDVVYYVMIWETINRISTEFTTTLFESTQKYSVSTKNATTKLLLSVKFYLNYFQTTKVILIQNYCWINPYILMFLSVFMSHDKF